MNNAPIDPRGPQFNAALTSVVLVAVLATATTSFGPALLAVQAALFATGVLLGVQHTPAAYLFRRFVRPSLSAPTHLEDPRPPRFAQGIGLLFTVVGLVGLLVGPTWLGYAAVGAALVAALLNATIQVCLGCKVYGVCHLPQNTYTHPRTTQQKESIA
jgi:FtsH-binding integral membrane protein